MVIDASVAIKGVFDEAFSDAARRILVEAPLAAPAFIDVEAANAVRSRTARGELDGEEALGVLAGFRFLPIRRVPDAGLLASALRLGVALSHPVYDCLYLALALDVGTDLFTADRRFAAVMRAGGFGDRLRFIGADQP